MTEARYRDGARKIAPIAVAAFAFGLSFGLLARATGFGFLEALVMSLTIFAGSALLFSNLTALALEPLGHIAGTASAVVMSVSTLAAVPLGRLVAEQVHDSPMPLFTGFAVFGTLTLAAVLAADRVRRT